MIRSELTIDRVREETNLPLLSILLLQLHTRRYQYEVSYQHQRNFPSAECDAAAALWYNFVAEEKCVNTI